ncbi:type II secretion system protein (plasmid) [Halopseudomonas sp. SMJS2]|uniref:type II secretion system protein n=1 Tax=Halopseudomonas sp. SMJS2 TaxID=3041098 RepID=UPI002452AEA6|nr:type II secretion system protein [Halopseudomonas sp. SMJS2]WGK63352.1 type II secretion system protein [Halopseudomonas sp. SMJS2]
MNSKNRQSGFTLIEISIVVAVISLLAAFILPTAFDQLQTAKVEGSIEQANNIAYQCDIARRSPVSSARNPDFSVTHTYASLPDWSPVSALEAMLDGDHNIRSVNPFGRPFLVRFDERNCYVAIDLDFLAPGIFGQETVQVGGMTRIIVTGKARGNVSTEWVRHQQRSLYNESSR